MKVDEKSGRGREVSSRWCWLWRRRRRLPHLWLGSSGEGHVGWKWAWGRGVWGICAIKCTILSPAAAFLGKGKLSRAIVVIPYLRSPSCTWRFEVGLATTEGSLGNAPCTWRIRDVFPSWQCRGRAALPQNPNRYRRVCAAGNFTCRCRSLLMI